LFSQTPYYVEVTCLFRYTYIGSQALAVECLKWREIAKNGKNP